MYSKSKNKKVFISSSDLVYSFPNEESLFRGLNFSIGKGITGIIGPNGSGKSTLLKFINGILEPCRGKMITVGNVAMLEQNLFAES